MPEFVERYIVQVKGVDLDDLIISVDESSTRKSNFVHTMNKARRPKGIKQGNNEWKLTMKAEPIVDSRIPDWHELKNSGEVVKASIRPNVGKARTYTGKITEVSESGSDGDSSLTITMMAYNRR